MEKNEKNEEKNTSYIIKEKVPALWRPPCACGIAMPQDIYKEVIKYESKKVETDK